jgi:hypothetical protein
MKDYNNAFLGVILAGVLMLVIGLSLLIRPGPVLGGGDRAATAERTVGFLVRNRADGQPSRHDISRSQPRERDSDTP